MYLFYAGSLPDLRMQKAQVEFLVHVFPINARKSVTLSPKCEYVVSAGVVDVIDLLSLPPIKATAFLSYSNVSLMSSKDLLGKCFNCWAAY